MSPPDERPREPRRSITPKPGMVPPQREAAEQAYRAALGSWERVPIDRDGDEGDEAERP